MDDIWDDDAVKITRAAPRSGYQSDSDDDHVQSDSRPSKRARTSKPLFNPDSDDDTHDKNDLPPEVNALFEGLDDDDFVMGLPPQLDTAQLQQDAEKRAAVESARKRLARGEVDVLGQLIDDEGGKTGSGDKPAKQKRVVPKLDEARLLDRDGLPALVRQAKDFKIKGKGHELSDLNRLMQMYQLWAHKMFPKMQFHDTVERVERLCRTKRMHVALSTWRDIENPPAAEEEPDADETTGREERNDHYEPTGHPPTSSPARITLEPGGPPIRQSQAFAEPDEDEEEMWRDMAEAMVTQNQAEGKEKEKNAPAPGAPGRKEPEEQFAGYDEDDWAAMDDVEQQDSEKLSTGARQAGPSNASSSPGPEHDVSSDVPPEPSGPSEDEDDFYAMYEP